MFTAPGQVPGNPGPRSLLHCFFATNIADDARFNANGNCASRANDPMPLSE